MKCIFCASCVAAMTSRNDTSSASVSLSEAHLALLLAPPTFVTTPGGNLSNIITACAGGYAQKCGSP